jgi:hypothetical protein
VFHHPSRWAFYFPDDVVDGGRRQIAADPEAEPHQFFHGLYGDDCPAIHELDDHAQTSSAFSHKSASIWSHRELVTSIKPGEWNRRCAQKYFAAGGRTHGRICHDDRSIKRSFGGKGGCVDFTCLDTLSDGLKQCGMPSVMPAIPAEDETDLVWGAAAIGRVIGRTKRLTYHLLRTGVLDGAVGRVGHAVVGSRRALLDLPFAARGPGG